MNVATFLTKGERTRAQIIAVAARLFWQRSFHGVSVDEVALAARVNKATIYRYFADKNDLALAVVRHNGAASLDLIFAQSLAESAPPDAQLASIYRTIYCAQRQIEAESGDVFGCPIISLVLELGHDLPEVRTEALKIFARVEAHLVTIAREALTHRGAVGDPVRIGRTLMQLLHGGFAAARLAANPDQMLDAGAASLALIGYPATPILPEDTPRP